MSVKKHGVDELAKARSQSLGLVGWVFFFSIFVNLLMLVGPIFMLQVYDRVLASGSEATLVAMFALVAALYALMSLLDFARGRIMARCGARLQEALDTRVFEVVLKRSILPQERSAPQRALRDLEAIRSILASPGFLAILDFPWVPVFIAALFIFHPLMGWLGIAGAIVLIVLAVVNQFLTRKKIPDMQTASARSHGLAEETRRHIEIVRAHGMGDQIVPRWNEMREKGQDFAMAHNDLSGAFQASTKAFRLFLQSAMLALGAWLVLQAELTAGAMIAGSIILGRALAPIEQSLSQLKPLQSAGAAWRSLGNLLAQTPPEEKKTELPRPEPRLSVKSVAISPVGSATAILSQVDFSMDPGDVIGVVGPSGTGKSSLLRTLIGVWPPRAGEVRLGAARLDQYNPSMLGGYVGYLPQEVDFFSGSVAENIARMAGEPDETEVIRAAKAACVHELILTLPQGYDTIMKSGETDLSAGQKQRIALARALYGDPAFLVLDEPNSALDAEGQEALNEAILKMKTDGKIVIISSHHPAGLAAVDRLIVLGNGTVVAQGPRDQILKSMIAAIEKNRKAG